MVRQETEDALVLDGVTELHVDPGLLPPALPVALEKYILY